MASTAAPGLTPVPTHASAPSTPTQPHRAATTPQPGVPGSSGAPSTPTQPSRAATMPQSGVPGEAVRSEASGARAEAPTVPAHMLPHRTPAQLLAIARQGLAEAAHTTPDGLRYAAAHLAALRAAAALLAARARPAAPGRRTRATSVWSLLVLVAPEFGDWAGYFALGAGKRAAAEAGIPHVVSAREADDLLRAAEQFVAVAESSLGVCYQPPLAA